MNKNAKDLISLIKMLLTKNYVMLESPNYSEIYKIAKYHSIQNMLYYAIMEYKEAFSLSSTIDPTLLKQLSIDNKNALAKAAYQEAEKEAIFKALEENKIDYMPMKGSIIKYLYPTIDMRSMADLDIYFDDAKSAEVRKILINLGYEVKSYKKSNHDTYVKIPFMNIEMHRDLFGESYAISRYYKNFWPRLEKTKTDRCEYQFNINDYYVFMVAHSSVHFSFGGMGIRNVIDEFIYLNKYQNKLDYFYIEEELKSIGIYKFESNLKKLSSYWFEDKELNEEDTKLMEKMADYIIESGTYGTIEHNVLNDFMGKDVANSIHLSKTKFIIKKMFPPVGTMKEANPILNKVIIMLPWFYFTRLLKAVFKRRKKTNTELRVASKLDEEKVRKNKEMHDDIGA